MHDEVLTTFRCRKEGCNGGINIYLSDVTTGRGPKVRRCQECGYTYYFEGNITLDLLDQFANTITTTDIRF